MLEGARAAARRGAFRPNDGTAYWLDQEGPGPYDDIEQRRLDIMAAVEAVDDGSGVILLTDMFGGTPSNLAISIMDKGRVEIIAGVNLPMLIKLASVRDGESLDQAVVSAQEAGRKYINVASTLLNVEQGDAAR